MDRNILAYILYLAGDYYKKFSQICKHWDAVYIKATKTYAIKIKFKPRTTNEEFIRIIGLPRFSDTNKHVEIISLDISHCYRITLVNIIFTKLKILKASKDISKMPLINTLEKLYIKSKSDINTLPSFTNLRELTLYKDIKLPDSIKNTLVHLYIYYDEIVKLLDFTTLKKLHIISSYNYIKIPPSVCETLVELNLFYCKCILPNFNMLKKLELTSCYTNEIPISICKTLEYLHVHDMDISIDLVEFSRLKILHIWSCQNTKNIPLSVIDTLEELMVTDCENLIIPTNFTRLVFKKIIEKYKFIFFS